jgi:hypothetical protein
MPMHVHFETAQGLRRKGYTVESLPSAEESSKETSLVPVGEDTVLVEELLEEFSVRREGEFGQFPSREEEEELVFSHATISTPLHTVRISWITIIEQRIKLTIVSDSRHNGSDIFEKITVRLFSSTRSFQDENRTSSHILF